MTTATEITVAFPDTARVGEGPFWSVDTGRLTWVDILDGTITTGDPGTGDRHTITLPTMVGAAVPKRSGGFIAAVTEGFADIADDGGWSTRLPVLTPGVRMNDAKCDPAGRFWAGSCAMDFAAGKGALHVVRPDWTTEVVLTDLTQPNGMDWSPDGRTYYLIDTAEGELNAYDLDPEHGTLANRRLLTRFDPDRGYADGMTVDADGCLWIAIWGGSRVVRLSPDGELLTEIPVPVEQPSSCAFGGAALDVLYVTSAREGLDDAPPPAGSVLAVHGLGVRGRPATRFGG